MAWSSFSRVALFRHDAENEASCGGHGTLDGIPAVAFRAHDELGPRIGARC